MAKPTPLQIGRPHPHILQSHGAECYIMNFYITNYATSFTKPSTDHNKSKFGGIPAYSGDAIFKPRIAPEINGSGFTSNVRPQIFYKESLDKIDNPEMRRICAENYETMHKRQFQAHKLNDGNEELPVQVQGQTTAFVKNCKVHNSRPFEVADLYINTKYREPFEVLPKHVPLFKRLNNKDPIPKENFDNGVSYMISEYASRFDEKKSAKLPRDAKIGPKELSGFVTNKESDTISGVPGERWMFRSRSTGDSNYNEKYVKYGYPRGDEFLPNLMGSKETGHGRSILPSEVNPKSDIFGNPSEYDDKFKGIQRPLPKTAEEIGTSVIGKKELNGQTRLESGFVQTLDDQKRFFTNYQTNFIDKNPKGKDREGYVVGGVTANRKTGFSNRTVINESDKLDESNLIRNLESYQSRSIRARDTFFNDKTHQHKLSLQNIPEIQQDNSLYPAKISCY